MRAIMLMFDSLKKDWLPPYGGDIAAPNFTRLAEHTVSFDNCYIGSMPCMPARREIHTGRYNFLHRGWGPLEPFDDSMPELLSKAGIHTHLISDHHHYWRDGGANYHGRYSTYENVRGQEGDHWKGNLSADPANTHMEEDLPFFFKSMIKQDGINRQYMQTEDLHCQTLTFDLGLEFMETNADADNWMLQVECFDPHEPFFTYEHYQKLYQSDYEGRHVDWPSPTSADQDAGYITYLQNQYKALVSQIDGNLGRLLDKMDEKDMWKDTMLIVNTDHGLLLAEHNWWSKGMMPTYNEIANLPLFIWDPRTKKTKERRQSLVQNIDIAATLLDFFGQPVPKDMDGRPLKDTIDTDKPVHDCILYGYFGGNTNITDGRYTYFRGPVSPRNEPLYEYTLIPAKMGERTSVKDLQNLELQSPFSFTKGCKTLKIDAAAHSRSFGNMYRFGSRLYDLHTDPNQTTPINDTATELRLINRMLELMKENDAPKEQYERLGLSENMTEDDLCTQRETFQASFKPQCLEDLDFSVPAGLMLNTLIGMQGKEPIESGFSAYIQKEGIKGQILPAHIYGFVKTAIPVESSGMATMMLKINERVD